MTETLFSLQYIEGLIDKCLAAATFRELQTGGDPYRSLVNQSDSVTSAGYLRLWEAVDEPLLDRMIHLRLQSPPVETQLFFLFGQADSAMPHFHAQAVQFSADGCVYNADLIPRLDPVIHPDYFRQVFSPLSNPYWRATKNHDNVCAFAPANPAIAAYLSPWSIGTGSPTDRAELERVMPQLHAYLDHYLALATGGLDYEVADTENLRARNQQHLDCFFADKLDPRAWKGVYGVIGEEAGLEIKTIFKNNIINNP
jgi:hypothetical protein